MSTLPFHLFWWHLCCVWQLYVSYVSMTLLIVLLGLLSGNVSFLWENMVLMSVWFTKDVQNIQGNKVLSLWHWHILWASYLGLLVHCAINGFQGGSQSVLLCCTVRAVLFGIVWVLSGRELWLFPQLLAADDVSRSIILSILLCVLYEVTQNRSFQDHRNCCALAHSASGLSFPEWHVWPQAHIFCILLLRLVCCWSCNTDDK